VLQLLLLHVRQIAAMRLVQERCIVHAAAELVMLVVLGPYGPMQAGRQLQADSAAAKSHRLLLVLLLLLLLQVRDGTCWC
jgi:hypothetical protein